jgi:hypothetical protein
VGLSPPCKDVMMEEEITVEIPRQGCVDENK